MHAYQVRRIRVYKSNSSTRTIRKYVIMTINLLFPSIYRLLCSLAVACGLLALCMHVLFDAIIFFYKISFLNRKRTKDIIFMPSGPGTYRTAAVCCFCAGVCCCAADRGTYIVVHASIWEMTLVLFTCRVRSIRSILLAAALLRNIPVSVRGCTSLSFALCF